MSLNERLDHIVDQCHSGIGSKTIEPEKSLRLIRELCEVVKEHLADHPFIGPDFQSPRLKETLADIETSLMTGPDEVESRPQMESSVTRRKKGQ